MDTGDFCFFPAFRRPTEVSLQDQPLVESSKATNNIGPSEPQMSFFCRIYKASQSWKAHVFFGPISILKSIGIHWNPWLFSGSGWRCCAWSLQFLRCRGTWVYCWSLERPWRCSEVWSSTWRCSHKAWSEAPFWHFFEIIFADWWQTINNWEMYIIWT